MKKMLMGVAAFCCMMLSMVILSACDSDDDKETAYYIKTMFSPLCACLSSWLRSILGDSQLASGCPICQSRFCTM